MIASADATQQTLGCWNRQSRLPSRLCASNTAPVCRVAGNVVNDFVLGSIIFAVQHLGCRLVVVLGHSRCSVVASAVQTWARKKSLTKEKENPTVRTLAESVQQTLGHSPSPPVPPQAVSAPSFDRLSVGAEDQSC